MVSVRVNGKTFELFKQLDMADSLDEMSKECQLVVTKQVDDISFVKRGDLIEVYFDEIKSFTGYVFEIDDSEAVDSHDVTIIARSKFQDIIDSSIPDNVKTLKNVTTLANLCNLVLTGLNSDIKVIDRINAKFDDDLKSGEVGQECGDFLQGYARKGQVFINSNGDGDIVLQRPEGKMLTILASYKGFAQNNIKESNLNIDDSERFYKYIVRSSLNVTSKKKQTNLTTKGEAFDNEIRKTRVLEIIADKPMSNEECKKAAQEKANIRRIRSFNYTCIVVGFSANNELWETGKLVKVNDQRKGVQGLFLIKEVYYSYSNAGELTTLILTYSDAYKVEEELSPALKKTVKAGDTYTDKKKQSKEAVKEPEQQTLKGKDKGIIQIWKDFVSK